LIHGCGSAPGVTREFGTRTIETVIALQGQQAVRNVRSRSQLEAVQLKSNTVTGDRKNPTPYSLSIARLIRDDPYTYRYTDGTLQNGEPYLVTSGNGYISETQTGGLSDVLPRRFESDLEGAFSQSLTEARNRLRGQVRAQNGADLAEARKTANTIASTSTVALQAYHAFRVGNFERAMKLLGFTPGSILSGKASSEQWLQFLYGIMPLILSVKDNIDLLSNSLRGNSLLITASCTTKVKFRESPLELDGLRRSWHCDGLWKVAYKAAVRSPAIDFLDRAGLINPLTIAWELVPYSFVLDWFIPVGSFLTSLSATAGLEFQSGYATRRSESYERISRIPSEQGEVILTPGSLVFGRFEMERIPLTGFALPSLYGKDNPFSTTHIVTALALLRQLM